MIVEGGSLKITAKKEGNDYTSARIKTQGLYDFTYGRVEVRAKLPSAQGTWPAIWMLGSNHPTVGWPSSGEVDIMEQRGNDKSYVEGTCHWYNTAGSNNASYGETTSIENPSTEFHLYTLEWTEDAIKIFLDDVALISDLDKDSNKSEPKVSLMTIHLAKGLEFSNVYIVGLEEDLFPSALSSTTRSDLEEERRLFYVALTRAKKKIILSHSKTRYRWGKLNDCEPSRFISEINPQFIKINNIINSKVNFNKSSESKIRFKKPERKLALKKITKTIFPSNSVLDYIDINIGDSIIHNRFGKGTVLTTEGIGGDKKAEVKFETSGLKKILLKFAKYQKVG